MTHFLCKTCGVQYAAGDAPPAQCDVCRDERQYLGWNGQEWTTLDELRMGHANEFRQVEPGLTAVVTTPKFAIGQRALLVESPGGNVLWDCVSLLDDATVDAVRSRGGLAAVAVSHPHFYSTVAEWSRAFGGVPVYLHADDRRWLMRPDPSVVFWEGETKPLHDGITLVRCGGHFAGSSALHWPSGADGRGALLTGDTLQVASDRAHVGFMRSYPNWIPLPPSAVRRIARAVEPFAFDRIHGMYPGLTIASGAKQAVADSVERYLKAIEAPVDAD